MSEDPERTAVTEALYRAVKEAVAEVAGRSSAIRKAVEIELSPLQKFLGKIVVVGIPGNTYNGKLTDFGPGWIEITTGTKLKATVIYTGPGVIVMLDHTEL